MYNLSLLTITKGSSNYGYAGYYALDVYTDEDTASKLTTENDFIIHTDGDVKTVVQYVGNGTEVEIPAGVTNIKSYAFFYCTGLTSITIPDSVTSIGYYAFLPIAVL